ncbi:hypothetical protein BD626DRAFT_478411 [Schizophyllum amplum]|uniref:Uncharacterized protein n=1 Tax=Schizophyllum amplum TaxID=97359 RepID=A0A550CRC2_9AGAR|nr:hypothetical protein BD626DRAFT_478411 [Auriculariopsis ampla]
MYSSPSESVTRAPRSPEGDTYTHRLQAPRQHRSATLRTYSATRTPRGLRPRGLSSPHGVATAHPAREIPQP